MDESELEPVQPLDEEVPADDLGRGVLPEEDEDDDMADVDEFASTD